MRKKICIGIALVLLLLCGCGEIPEALRDDTDTSGELVPVAQFTNLAVDLSEAEMLRTDSSAFYFVTRDWKPEYQVMEASLYRMDLSGGKKILQGVYGDENLSVRFLLADSECNIYLWAGLSGKESYLLRKYDAENTLLWETDVDLSQIAGARPDFILGGIADGEGRICLYDDLGKIYLFDEEGNFRKLMNLEKGTLSGFLATEDNILMACYLARNDSGRGMVLECVPVDLDTGKPGEESLITLAGNAMPFIQSGSGNSMIYIDNGIIWEWNFNSGEKSALLYLDDTYVSIEGTEVIAVNTSEQGVEGLLLRDTWFGCSEYAAILYEDKKLLPEKKTITLGTTPDLSAESMQQFVTRFNRQSKEWKVEIVEYFSYLGRYGNFLDEFTKDILDGNAPDLIDVRSVPVELLADKGFFEDLSPYFKKSAVVNKKDILDSIWDAGIYGKELCFVIPWFGLDSYLIKKDNLKNKDWDIEEFMRLLDEQRESSVFFYRGSHTERALLEYALYANMERFCNPESGTCDFTDGTFAELLEAINRRQDHGTRVGEYKDTETWERLLADEILLCQNTVRSVESYYRVQQALGQECRWVGYPSQEGQYHGFSQFMILGMNSGSGQKEGAWDFLEYLLSEDVQNWSQSSMSVFPVREDAFDNYISEAYDEKGERSSLTEEEKRALRKLAENAHLHPYRIFDPLYDIVLEESDEYFAGRRTASETAEIIQNRVQLYLDEIMYVTVQTGH